MLANRLKLIRGASASFDVDLVDAHGEPIASTRLENCVATFTLRDAATGPDILRYTSADKTHLSVDIRASRLAVAFTPMDTSALALGAYVYELRLQLANGDVVVPVGWSPLDVGLGGVADETQPVFENVIRLDHDFPLPGDMTYMTPGGSPIPDAQIRVYAKADYDARRLDAPIGHTTTNAHGKWNRAILVVPGYTYVVHFFKPGEFGPDVKQVVGV